MDLSFIIPAYNEEELLPKTLDALKSILNDIQDDYSVEIIVVDNNSDDNTADIAKKYGAKVVFEPDNCIAKARNRGAKEATGNYFFFIDADTIPGIEIIKKSLNLLSTDKVCGGGARVHFDKPLPFFAKLTLLWWESMTSIIPLAAGSYIYCRSEAFREIGGFYEKVYASEEVNFSYKLKKWGRKNKMKFILLKEKVLTSSRKIDWYSPAHMFFYIIFNACFPFLLRNRKFCYMWYRRPTNKDNKY